MSNINKKRWNNFVNTVALECTLYLARPRKGCASIKPLHYLYSRNFQNRGWPHYLIFFRKPASGPLKKILHNYLFFWNSENFFSKLVFLYLIAPYFCLYSASQLFVLLLNKIYKPQKEMSITKKCQYKKIKRKASIEETTQVCG